MSIIKLDISELQLGMYVTEIDRPWLESPFLFQGFILDNNELMGQVSDTCKYVYVDTEKSSRDVQSVLEQHREHEKPTVSQGVDMEFMKLADQFHSARFLYNKTSNIIKKMMQNISLGETVDTVKTKAMVEDMINVVSRHPSTMIWLTYLKDHDDFTLYHSINVCILTLSFGHWLGLDRSQLQTLGLGAILHDIGTMKVPTNIVQKTSALTTQEYERMQQHPKLGWEALRGKEYITKEVLDIVLHHHERYNGSGYPDKLVGEDNAYLTRLVALVDMYETARSDNHYRKGTSPHEVLKEMYVTAKENFGPDLVEKFIQCLGIYPIGSLVELERGDVAVVMSVNQTVKLRPVVLLVLDMDKKPYEVRKLMNLANMDWSETNITTILPPGSYGINVAKVVVEDFLPKEH